MDDTMDDTMLVTSVAETEVTEVATRDVVGWRVMLVVETLVMALLVTGMVKVMPVTLDVITVFVAVRVAVLNDVSLTTSWRVQV